MRDVKKHPWVEGRLAVGRSVLDRVDDEARRGYAKDEETCGFLVGPAADGRKLDGIVPMVNRANALHRLDPETYPRTARTYFDIDSMKFESAIARGEAEGRPVKVLYHSHLDAGAYFSPTDAEVAKMGQGEPPWDLAYLVTSVRAAGDGTSPATEGSADVPPARRPPPERGQCVVDDRKLFVWDPATRSFVESPLDIDEGS